MKQIKGKKIRIWIGAGIIMLVMAVLVKKAPSGNVYKNGNGKKVTNLGVHEHWNNPVSKKYSRNLGKKEGIELVKVE